MDAEATLVWIAAAPADAEQARAIASWGSAHGLRLVSPTVPLPQPPPLAGRPAVDLRIADDVAVQLERARDALAALDGAEVDRALATAEASLRAHPELPQAAWLLAEVERTRSTRLRRVAPA